ncbi:COP9 signalosome complex subunit 6 [Thoreauomyces humboldtii]|nr:COP9 signalosome complex subunit 6 [Thoreauomyces humboldtii]
MAVPMDTDDAAETINKVVSDASAASGLLITLHPLVITNISDQWTRTKVQLSVNNPLVIGTLLGEQVGRGIEIFDSFEIPFKGEASVDSSDLSVREINAVYLKDKLEKIKEVFPKYEVVGWYATGTVPVPWELQMHLQMHSENDSALFLKLDAVSPATAKDFPVAVYESGLETVAGESSQPRFFRAQYRIETGEAERIAVDHVARTSNVQDGKGSALITHLVSQRNAIKMLHSRTRLLHDYVLDVSIGRVPRDHDIMRQVASLCHRLPTIDSPDFRKEFLTDYNDVLLMTYLATITKGTSAAHDLVDTFNIVATKRPGASFPRGGITYS